MMEIMLLLVQLHLLVLEIQIFGLLKLMKKEIYFGIKLMEDQIMMVLIQLFKQMMVAMH